MAHDIPSVAVRWAMELVDEISANQDNDRVRSRALMNERVNRETLLTLAVTDAELENLVRVGRYAEELLAERTP